MNNQAFSKIWIIVILIVLIAGGILLWQYWQKGYQEILPIEKEEEKLVEETVILFGQRIQNVGGKIAPIKVIREDMEREYSDLLSNQLYSKWIKDPTNALVKIQGRPWPDRIEITSLTKVRPVEYQVKGLLIWKSSTDEGIDGLELRVIREKDEVLEREMWVIDNINFFALPIEEIAHWKTYKNTENGFSFLYPKNWIIDDCIGDKKCEGANNIVEVRSPNNLQTNLLDSFSVEIFGTFYCSSTISSARNVWKWETFKESEYKILEYKGVLFEGSSQFQDNRFYTRKLVLIEKDNKCFQIDFLHSKNLTDQETFDQILSTFKFLE